MRRAAFCIFVSLFCTACVNLHGALLAPKHPQIALGSIEVVGNRNFERIPGPFVKITFTSETDLAEMTRDRHLITEVQIYRCAAASNEPPDAFNPSVLAYDPGLRDQDDADIGYIDSDVKRTAPTAYHAYINVKWPWPPSVPDYDLSKTPDNLCIRVRGGTSLEMGNLLSDSVTSNVLFIPASRLKEVLAQYR